MRALGAVAPDLDGTALAEVLWLAARIGAGPAVPQAGASPEPPAVGAPKPPAAPSFPGPGPGHTAAPGPSRPLHERLRGASARISGAAVATPQGAGLPLAEEVTRALRPWKRPWPRGHRPALDIDATVDGYARSGELIPVFRPAPERWFGLVLVVDRSPAMRVWRETIADFTAVLDRLGAFRTLQTRELGFGANGPEIRDGLGRLTGPGELRSPDARRLVIVVSDCAGPQWREPEVWRRIRGWSLTTPVALLNPLPPKLWRRTALGLPSVRVQASAPGADSLHLTFDRPLLPPDEDQQADTGDWLPLPVLSTSPHSLDQWSRALMRGAPEGCGAVLVPRAGRLRRHPPPREHAGAATAEGFLRTASPGAVRLAVLCAPFGRLSMSLLHLIRQDMVPDATVADLAELLTSGLFTIETHGDGPVELVADPVVRLRLERELTVHEVRRMDRALERAARPGRLPAVAYAPHGHAEHLAGERAFAHARRRTLELLGLPAEDRPPLTGRGEVVDLAWHREPYDVRPYFFLSYAHTPPWGPGGGDPDHWVHVLFNDLCSHIMALTDLPAGAPAGFMDREMRSGEGWPHRLSESLANCRVLVPLLSPRYFTSEACGREWYAFNERIVHARTTGYGVDPAIVPALWTHIDHTELPESVRRLSLVPPDLGGRYAQNGIYGLIKLNRLRDEYEEVVFRLARRIVRVAHESPLPPGRPRDYESTPSAFKPRGTGPRHIHLYVAAPTRGSIPDERDPQPYGANAQDWNPYFAESTRPLAALAEDLVRSLDYRVTVSSFDDEPSGDGSAADATQAVASPPAILLVDRWALADEERRRRLRAFDSAARPWVSVIVPGSRSDTQNFGEDGLRLTAELERTLPTIMDRSRRTDARIAVNGVPTLKAFSDVLPTVVAQSTRQYLKHATARPPAGPHVARPRLRGPVDPLFTDPGVGEGGES
ncbi:TIR-like protein FxsC [Streptomyces sp. NPDC050743]|uniref:TIR-like protein FxsC n=1 Tax=Streptomyces sp. NPDC050743 TaxID=3365634 RepID=UPI0037B40AD2